MHRFSFLGSSHIGFIEELYQLYLKKPDEVEPSWRAFFQGYDFALEEGEVFNEDEQEVPEEIERNSMSST